MIQKLLICFTHTFGFRSRLRNPAYLSRQHHRGDGQGDDCIRHDATRHSPRHTNQISASQAGTPTTRAMTVTRSTDPILSHAASCPGKRGLGSYAAPWLAIVGATAAGKGKPK
jgi:hypothetical protein